MNDKSKESQKKWGSSTVRCCCGMTYTKWNKVKHELSKKHQNASKNLQMNNEEKKEYEKLTYILMNHTKGQIRELKDMADKAIDNMITDIDDLKRAYVDEDQNGVLNEITFTDLLNQIHDYVRREAKNYLIQQYDQIMETMIKKQWGYVTN